MSVSSSASRFLLQTNALSASSCRDALATLDLMTSIPFQQRRYTRRQGRVIVHRCRSPLFIELTWLLRRFDSAPKNTSRVGLDFRQQYLDVWGWRYQIVDVELAIAVAPVKLPFSAGLRVAKSDDRVASPFWSEILRPRRTTFHNCDRTRINVNLVVH